MKKGQVRITSTNIMGYFSERWVTVLDIVTDTSNALPIIYARQVSKDNYVRFDGREWELSGEHGGENAYSTYIGMNLDAVMSLHTYSGTTDTEWLTPLAEVTA